MDKFQYKPTCADELTLRDYFAAQALIGLRGEGGSESCAEWCYRMADAMIKERNKNG